MTRRRTHTTAPRSRVVGIRVTEDDYARLAMDAKRFGMSVSGLCERLATTGNITVVMAEEPEMPPALFAELKRIGNNINQLAHAANGLLPPNSRQLAKDFSQLFNLITQNELIVRRMNDEFAKRAMASDPPPSQTR